MSWVKRTPSPTATECIRGEFSEPILEEDVFLKSFNFLRRGGATEQEVLDDASALIECSLQYLERGAEQECPAQSGGEQ